MNKKFCFEIIVAFNFKVPNNTKIFSQSSTYYIIADSKDNAMNAAICLNKTEYGDILDYQYKACVITNKKVVYVLNK